MLLIYNSLETVKCVKKRGLMNKNIVHHHKDLLYSGRIKLLCHFQVYYIFDGLALVSWYLETSLGLVVSQKSCETVATLEYLLPTDFFDWTFRALTNR